MSKNTTTPEFKVGDEVLIFADREGFYAVEEADTPLLREATIKGALDEDGDYPICCPMFQDRRWARPRRVFPLGTILVDGKPVRPEDQEQPTPVEGHSFHSDGGVFFDANHIITGDTINASKIHVDTGGSATMTFNIEEMSPETMRLYFGEADLGPYLDEYQRFLDEVASTLDNRGEDYGGVEDNFKDIAAMWSVITGTEIRADQVGLMMIALKLVRANKTDKRDNLLDIAGYAAHVAKIQGDELDEA